MNRFLAAAGFHGALAVAFGAWAAHGAAQILEPQAVDWVRTGASYQLWHALALLGVAALAGRQAVRLVTISGLAFFVGALLFSGSLYLLAWASAADAAGPGWLVYLTPTGGGLLILGWILLLAAGLQKGSP
ncbi:DUF423 domain-containing protein [Dongia sp.]|uniref:DUF423 domain-containing protein n=1 Tax=Dongia sp. TaxID=1977262 RepID=UPI0035B06D40